MQSSDFRKVVLPNGIRVLSEVHPSSRAVSCGVWVSKGTRHERAHEAGLAHFIEHMVFKRTSRRSAYEIARVMEAVGGDLNAFTSREYTSFVTHSLKEHLGLSLDVLSDLVCQPSFHASDIKKEKQVVIQELHMAEDQLEDAIFDHFFQRIYPDSPLGRPILGSVKSIEEMPRRTVLDFFRRQYTAENMMVSVAGNISHDEVLDLVVKHLNPHGQSAMGEMLNEQVQADTLVDRPRMQVFRDVIKRPSEQVHLLLGLPSNDFRHHLRFDGFIVNTLLGGGMTSRLYQKIREDKGLVYSVYSQLVTFMDAGLNLIYAGTEPKNVPDVLEITMKEIRRLRKKGVSKEEVEFFKTQVKGSILLGADDIENRMNSLGVNEMVFGRYRSVDDVMCEVEKISVDSVHEYIETFLDPEQVSILLMGALPEAPTRKWLEQL